MLHPLSARAGRLNFQLNFQKTGWGVGVGRLIGPHLLEGDAEKAGGGIFSRGISIFKKTRLKSEIFKDKQKKAYNKQKYFSLS